MQLELNQLIVPPGRDLNRYQPQTKPKAAL